MCDNRESVTMSTLSFYMDDAADRPKTADGAARTRPAMIKRPTLGSRNVSFDPSVPQRSSSIKSPVPKRPEPRRFNSEYSTPELEQTSPTPKGEPQVQRIDRHAQNVDPALEPALPYTRESRDSPFAIYDDSFAHLLGHNPGLDHVLSDSRGPFFYSGGAYLPRISTCFLTSDLLQDLDPFAAGYGTGRVEITKVEFYSAQKLLRDKVRCPERSYMAAGAAAHPSNDNAVIFCTQGSLHETAGLVSIDAKRPHKSKMLLNNFHGKPFNSPTEVVSNPIDQAVYFLDPPYGYERGFRPKPKLPSGHIYRFHPASGDCRVVAHDLKRPAGLAFSPDYRTLYVSELVGGHEGVYIHAYDVSYANPSDAPSFNISVVPSTSQHAASNSSGSASSTESSRQPYRGRDYLTPDSSPQTPTVNMLGSHSRSGSQSRGHDMSHHKILTSMTNGLRSPSRGPTSQPMSAQLQPMWPLKTNFPSMNRKRGTFLSSKRLVVYSPNPVQSGAITTDPVHGDLWLGTEEGLEIWNSGTGELTGKILTEEWDAHHNDHSQRSKMRGCSKVVFVNDSEALLLGGERIWRLRMGQRGMLVP